MSDMDYDEQGYTFPMTINYDKISKDKSFLPFVRILAMDMNENPYISIGTFLQSISDHDLKGFMAIIEDNEELALEHIILLTEMLAQGEGLASENLTQLTDRTNTMLTYMVIESLKRRGFVKVFYENISFGDEFGDKIIVEKLFDEK